MRIRGYKAGGVLLGYLSHLILDELYSIEWRRGRLRLKQSFGTAVKLFGTKWWPNISTLAKLVVLTYLVMKEPGWMAKHYQEQIRPPIQETAEKVVDRVIR